MEKGDQIPNALGLLININKCEGEAAILGKNTRTDGRIYQGDTLKHTFTKKYHNVSSGVSPKAENKVQQQMSSFVRWLGVVRWRKRARLLEEEAEAQGLKGKAAKKSEAKKTKGKKGKKKKKS